MVRSVDSVERVVTLNGSVLAAVEDARRLADDSLELLQTILDHIPVMITLLDLDGRIVYLNSEATRLLGWTTEEVQTHPNIMGALVPDEAERNAGRDFILMAERLWQEWRPLTKSGGPLPSQ